MQYDYEEAALFANAIEYFGPDDDIDTSAIAPAVCPVENCRLEEGHTGPCYNPAAEQQPPAMCDKGDCHLVAGHVSFCCTPNKHQPCPILGCTFPTGHLGPCSSQRETPDAKGQTA